MRKPHLAYLMVTTLTLLARYSHTNWWSSIRPPCEDEAKAEHAIGSSDVCSE